MNWRAILRIFVFGLVVVGCASKKDVSNSSGTSHASAFNQTKTSESYQVIEDSLWIYYCPIEIRETSALDVGALERRSPPTPPERPPFIVSAAQRPKLVAIRHQKITQQQKDTIKATHQEAIIEEKKVIKKEKAKKIRMPIWHATLAALIFGFLTIFLLRITKK